MKVGWGPREPPLPALGVAARGEAAARLAQRLLATARYGALEGLTAGDVLLLLGEDLPWTDPCVYLGRDPDVPSLYLPTILEPRVPQGPPGTGPRALCGELLERAIALRFPGADGPFAILPGWAANGCGAAVISLAHALPITRKGLNDWLRR